MLVGMPGLLRRSKTVVMEKAFEDNNALFTT
jgi:hypothetical protein